MEPLNQVEIKELDPIKEFCKFYEENDPKKAMKRACEILVLNNETSSHPIEFNNILTKFNAKIEEKVIPTNGRLEIKSDHYQILVRQKSRLERKRFTIAHELAHIIIVETLLDKPDHLKKLLQPETWNKIEKLCNFAAAQILVPDGDFMESIKKFGLTSKGIESIRSRYQVSYEVIFQKFIEIFSPTAIILWKSKGTGLDQIAPKIIRYPYSSIPNLSVKEDSTGTPRLRTIIKTAISKGKAWTNNMKCDINGKESPVMVYAIPTLQKNPFTKIRIVKTPNRKYEEKEISYYDVVMFYLPHTVINDSEVLQLALTVD